MNVDRTIILAVVKQSHLLPFAESHWTIDDLFIGGSFTQEVDAVEKIWK